MIKKLCQIFFTGIVLCLFNSAFAQSQYAFEVERGQVTVTPSFCPPERCESTSATVSGEFKASIGRDDTILFPASNLSTKPDVSFQLPLNPNEDSGGTVRDARFSFDGNRLEIKGVIDSRAFDGPLIEYSLSAVISTDEFNAKSFFSVRPDYRKCVSPLCGGFFVKKVNQRYTMCADGTRQRECYVANLELPFGIPRPDYSKAVLMQGKISAKDFPGFGNLGEFTARAAYQGVSDQEPKGRYLGVQNNGIVCITSPCFSYDEYLLNSERVTSISQVELERAGASKEDLARAWTILGNGDVLLATGFNRKIREFSGIGIRFTATQIFLPLEPVYCPFAGCEK